MIRRFREAIATSQSLSGLPPVRPTDREDKMGLVVPLAILSSLRLSSLSHPHHSQVESAAAPFAVPPPLPPMLLPQADSAADGDGATVPGGAHQLPNNRRRT